VLDAEFEGRLTGGRVRGVIGKTRGVCEGRCGRLWVSRVGIAGGLGSEAQEAQADGGSRADVAQGGSDVRSARQAHEADGEVAKASEHLGTVACAHLTAILVEGDVADPVEPVFDAPVASGEFEQLGGRGLVRREARQAADDLVMELAGGKDFAQAFDLKDLAAVGKVDVVVEFGAGPDSTDLQPAVCVVGRLSLRGE